MKTPTLVPAVLALAILAACATGAAAQTQSCLLASGQPQGQNGQPPFGPPMIITGQGTSSQQNTAMTAAQQDWSNKASGRGQGYGVWFKAANKTSNCSSSKPGFQWIYSCTVRAQPCR
ncbi:MAG: hypothetical protein Q8L66_15150 [Caulobacter sp.]|nr:hypothetical protein [Caulobacter sp.]